MTQINPRGSVPTFVIDGSVAVGFGPGQLKTIIEAAARRRAARW